MGTSSEFRFDHASVRRRVVLAVTPSGFQEEVRGRLVTDGHQLVTTSEVAAFEFTLGMIADGIGAPPGVIVAGSSFAHGDWMRSVRRCRDSLRGTLVLVLDEGLDDEELDAIEDEGWVTLRAPIRIDHVSYAVAHAEIWRFLRPSRAFFDRVGR